VTNASLIIVLLMQTTLVIAQAAPDLHSLHGIRTYCLDLEHLATSHASEKLMFSEVCSGIPCRTGNANAEWKQFLDEKSWHDAGGDDGLDNAAYVWLLGNRVVKVNFTFQSGSGDWVNYAHYCFRPDGSLAMLKSTLNTFHGEMTVERESFFSTTGTQLGSRADYLDLGSKKPKKPSPEFIDNPPPVFRTVHELPFFAVLPNS